MLKMSSLGNAASASLMRLQIVVWGPLFQATDEVECLHSFGLEAPFHQSVDKKREWGHKAKVGTILLLTWKAKKNLLCYICRIENLVQWPKLKPFFFVSEQMTIDWDKMKEKFSPSKLLKRLNFLVLKGLFSFGTLYVLIQGESSKCSKSSILAVVRAYFLYFLLCYEH